MGLSDLDLKGLARQGARLAASFAPVKTGRLAKSIRGRASRNRVTVTAGNRTAVPYAGAINYGWRRKRISAAGFMQRTDLVLRNTAPRQFDALVTRVLARNRLS
jgi:hypothetical protein